ATVSALLRREDHPFSCCAGESDTPALLLRSGRRWREAPDEGASEASCCCPSRQHQKHASLRSRPLIRPPGTFSREREKGFLPNSRRKVRDQPFSCAAGEGGATRRMRARAKRAAVAPSQAKIKSTLRCARAPSSAPRFRGGRLSGHLLP